MWSMAGIITRKQAGPTHIRRAVNRVCYQREGGVSLMWFAIFFYSFQSRFVLWRSYVLMIVQILISKIKVTSIVYHVCVPGDLLSMHENVDETYKLLFSKTPNQISHLR